MCKIEWCYSLCPFSTENILEGRGGGGKFGPKNRNCQFELKFSAYDHSQNVWHNLYFSCEIVQHGKSLITAFQEFFASIDKTFVLAARVGTRLSFYEF